MTTVVDTNVLVYDVIENFPHHDHTSELIDESENPKINSLSIVELEFVQGLDAFIPSPCGEHVAETNVFLRTVHLNRLSPLGSALPFQVWTLLHDGGGQKGSLSYQP